MHTLTPLSRRAGRIALTAAALLMMTGRPAAAAAAAPVPGSPLPGNVRGGPVKPEAAFGWHRLALINGWESASSPSLKAGTPAWALHDGVVYLSGAIMQKTGHVSSTFARLPKSVRPAHKLFIQVYTNNLAPGTLYVGPGGTMQASGGNAAVFTSLAAVSYPGAAIKAHRLKLEHGWASGQSGFGTGNPAYAVTGGVVYLSGSLNDSRNPQAAVLPAAARPARDLHISIYTSAGSTGSLLILPNGQIDVSGAGAVTFASLAGISFPVASTRWHAFTLINSWTSEQASFNTGEPAYAVTSGVVYLSGAMAQTSGDNTFFTARLPAAAQPAHILQIETYTLNGTVGGVALGPPPFNLANSIPFSNAQGFTSFAGIAYPLSS